MKKRVQSFLILLFVLCFVLSNSLLYAITPVVAQNENERVKVASEKCAAYLIQTVPSPVNGSIGGEWTVIGLARANQLTSQMRQNYLSNLKQSLDAHGGVLSDTKYTEYSRVLLALAALNQDGQNVYGYNLLAPLADFEMVSDQRLSGYVYALLAFDSRNYEIPNVSSVKSQTTRENLIEAILNSQLSDGGFCYSGRVGDTDMTAMVLTALAPYTSQRQDVKNAVESALSFLSKAQLTDGGFGTSGQPTLESNAQVLTALSALSISVEDTRFVKNGNTVLDAFLSYQMENGSFCHIKGKSTNMMATEQAYYAMVACERFLNQQTSLYDMTDVMEQKETSNATMTLDTFLEKVSKLSDTPSIQEEGTIIALQLELKEQGEFQQKQAVRDRLSKLVAYISEQKAIVNRLDQKIWDQIQPTLITQEDAKTIQNLMTEYNEIAPENRAFLKYSDDLLRANRIIVSLEKGVFSKELLENAKAQKQNFKFNASIGKTIQYQILLSSEKVVRFEDTDVSIQKGNNSGVTLPENAIPFSVGINGYLPGKLTITMTGLCSDGTYKLYRVDNKKSVLATTVKCSKESFSFETEHGGTYYLLKSVDTNSKNQNDKGQEDSKNQSSDNTNQNASQNTNQKGQSESNTSSNQKGQSESNTSSNQKGQSESNTSSNQKGQSENNTSSNQKGQSESNTSSNQKGQSESNTSSSQIGQNASNKSQESSDNSGTKENTNSNSVAGDEEETSQNAKNQQEVSYLENGKQYYSKEEVKEILGKDLNLRYLKEKDDTSKVSYETVLNGMDVTYAKEVDLGLLFEVDDKEIIEANAKDAFCFATVSKTLPGTIFVKLKSVCADGTYLLLRYDKTRNGFYYIDKLEVTDGVLQTVLSQGGTYVLASSVNRDAILNAESADIETGSSSAKIAQIKAVFLDLIEEDPTILVGLLLGILFALGGTALCVLRVKAA